MNAKEPVVIVTVLGPIYTPATPTSGCSTSKWYKTRDDNHRVLFCVTTNGFMKDGQFYNVIHMSVHQDAFDEKSSIIACRSFAYPLAYGTGQRRMREVIHEYLRQHPVQ